MKKIAILGSTGSIGTQTLDVVREHSDELQVVALAAGSNKERLKEQIKEFHPKLVSLSDEKKAQELKEELAGEQVEVVCGMEGLIEVAGADSADVVVTAVVGMMGILPTMEAIKKGILRYSSPFRESRRQHLIRFFLQHLAGLSVEKVQSFWKQLLWRMH